jgi:hypothetical protein
MPRSAAIAVRACAVVLALVALNRFCIVPFRCNRAILDARLLAARAAAEPTPSRASADAQRSSALVEPFVASCGRTEVNLHIILASNAITAGHADEALSHYDDALAIEQRPEIYFDRGMTQIGLRRTAAGEADLVRAVRFNPYLLDEIGGETRERVRIAVRVR